MKKPKSSAFLLPLSEEVWALPTTERKARILQNLAFNAAVHDARTTIPTSSSNPSKAPKICREALHLLQEEGESSSPRFETIY